MHDNAKTTRMETEAEIMALLRKNQTQYDDYEDKFYKKTRKNQKKRVRRQEREVKCLCRANLFGFQFFFSFMWMTKAS